MFPLTVCPATCELCGNWLPQHESSCARNGVHPSQWSLDIAQDNTYFIQDDTYFVQDDTYFISKETITTMNNNDEEEDSFAGQLLSKEQEQEPRL